MPDLPGATDPIVLAVAEDLWKAAAYDGDDTWENGDPMPERYLTRAQAAVAAHRRAVLDQRGDGERWARLSEVAGAKLAKSPPGAEVVHVRPAMLHEMLAALTAMADETTARRQAEADRDTLARLRDEALDKATDYCEMIAAVRAAGAAQIYRAVRQPGSYSRGVAQAAQDLLAVMDGLPEPADAEGRPRP